MRPIDADALKNAFEEDGHLSGYIEGFIDDMPTLDVAPVVHGRWINPRTPKGYSGLMCTVCRKGADWAYNYCPNCGARMDKED